MAEVTSFIDTFANSDSFAEIVFGLDFSKNEKKQITDHINKFWSTKLIFRTVMKTGVKSKTETHVCVYHIRTGEELRRWLERCGGENERYRLVPPGEHRRAGTCPRQNIREVLTSDSGVSLIDLTDEEVSRNEEKNIKMLDIEKQNKVSSDKENTIRKPNETESVGLHTAEKNKETVKVGSQEIQGDLEKLLDGFVLFYDANKNSQIDKDDWFSALCESFKLSKFGLLEVVSENIRPLRTKCECKWNNMVLASAEGLTETQAKTAATLQVMSKLEPFTYIIQAKEEYFFGGKVPPFIEKPGQNKSDFCRIVKRNDLPSYYSIFQNIDDFAKNQTYGEIIFGEDFPWELKNEIVVYLKAKGLDYRYFTLNDKKPSTHMAIYHSVNPEKLKDHLLCNGGENEKYKLIPPPKAEPSLTVKTQEAETRKDSENQTKKPAPAPPKQADKQKPPEPLPLLDDFESNKIHIKLKKFKKDKVEYPEDTGGDFPGLIIWAGIRKNSMWQRSLFCILVESFKMSKFGELLVEESEENVWGRKEPFKKCVIKCNRKVLAVGLGESKTEAKNSASLQVLRKLRKHSYTIQAKESYFKEGKATPYDFNPDPAKANVYRVIKRTRFRDRAAIFKFIDDFSRLACPEEELIFGSDFTYDERESILDHCRKIYMNYRLMKCQSMGKIAHTHIAVYHQRPLPVLKAELIKAGGQNDKFLLIPPGGKITLQNSNNDLWPDTLENGKQESFTTNSTTSSGALIGLNNTVNNQFNNVVQLTPENPPVPINVSKGHQRGKDVDGFTSKIGTATNTLSLNFDQQSNDIDNFAPTVHLVDHEASEVKNIPVKISGINAKKTSVKIDVQEQPLHNVSFEAQPQPAEFQTYPQEMQGNMPFVPQQMQGNMPFGPQNMQGNMPFGPQEMHFGPQQLPFGPQEVPFGSQPLYGPPPPMHGPYTDMPLVFGPQPQPMTYMPLQHPNVPVQQGHLPMQPRNIPMQSTQAELGIPQVVENPVTCPNSMEQPDLRDELVKKRRAENLHKETSERILYDMTTERKVMRTDESKSDNWSRKVFVAETEGTVNREESGGKSISKTPAGSGGKPHDLREKLRQKDISKDVVQHKIQEERSIRRVSPERSLQRERQQRNNQRVPPERSLRKESPDLDRRGRSPLRFHQRDTSRERFRSRDRLQEERIVRERDESHDRRIHHESPWQTRGDHRWRSRSRSPIPYREDRIRRSLSPTIHFRNLWDNISPHLADSVFMYKYVREDSTTETDPYALLRATRALNFNVDFDFIKTQLSIDEWQVQVELVTDDSRAHPLVGEGLASTEREASLIAAYHAVDTIQKACGVIEPNCGYFAQGGVPEFILRKNPMKTSLYEIIKNLDPTMPLERQTVEFMFKMFLSSDLEDLFFLATDFSYLERVLVVEIASQMNLWWRLFGPRHPGAQPDDVVSTQHVCVFKQKSALQLMRELLANGGSTEKYTLVDPRENRITGSGNWSRQR